MRQLYGAVGPGAYPVGDCYRTAWAAVLGLDDPELVPHFVQISIDNHGRASSGWHDSRLVRQWLRLLPGDLDSMDAPVSWFVEFAEANELTTFPVVATVPSRAHPSFMHSIAWDAAQGKCLLDPADWDVVEPYRPDEVVDAAALCIGYEPEPEAAQRRWEAGDFALDPAPHIYLFPADAFAQTCQLQVRLIASLSRFDR